MPNVSEKGKLEQELDFLKESYEAEVISKEEYEKGKERIEKKLMQIEEGKNNNKKEEKKEATADVKVHIEKKEEKPEAEEKPVAETAEDKKPGLEAEELKSEEPKPEEPKPEIQEFPADEGVNKYVWLLLIVVIIGGIYYFYFSQPSQPEIETGQPEIETDQIVKEKINATFFVINSENCFRCDTARIKELAEGWFPGIKKEELPFQGDEGKKLADELGLRLLPAYIFDKNITQARSFSEISQIFEKKGDVYVLSDEASSGKLYFARENKPNELILFVDGNSNSQKALDNVKELIDGTNKTNGKINFKAVDVNSMLARTLEIKSVPVFLINNQLKLVGVHPAETVKEYFCSMNSLSVCNETLSRNLK